MLQLVIWLRAYFLWSLLLGQGVCIAMFATGMGWEAISTGPWALEKLLGVLAVSGLAGCVGECAWHVWRGDDEPLY